MEQGKCICGAEMHGTTEAEVLDWYRRHAEVCAAMAKKMSDALKDFNPLKGGKN